MTVERVGDKVTSHGWVLALMAADELTYVQCSSAAAVFYTSQGSDVCVGPCTPFI